MRALLIWLTLALLAGQAAAQQTGIYTPGAPYAGVAYGIFVPTSAAPVLISTSKGFYVNQQTMVGTDKGGQLGVTNPTKLTIIRWQLATGNATYPSFQQGFWGPYTFSSNLATGCETSNPGLCISNGDSNSSRFVENYSNSAAAASTDRIKALGDGDPSIVPTMGVWNGFGTTLDGAGHYGYFRVVAGSPPVDISSHITVSPNTTGLTFDLNNQASNANGGFFLQNGGPAPSASWMADVVIMGESYACTGAGVPYASCTAVNTFAPEGIAKFVTAAGLPVKRTDAQCKDASPTNTQPLVCLTGDGDAARTNKGSATFNSGVLKALGGDGASNLTVLSTIKTPAAPYGPGAGIPAHVPTLRYVPEDVTEVCSTTIANQGASGTTIHGCPGSGSTFVAFTNGQPTTTADAIIIEITTQNSSTVPTFAVSACPSNLSATPGGATSGGTLIGPYSDASGDTKTYACYGFATDTTGTYLFTYTGTVGVRALFRTLDYASAAGFDGTASCQVTASTTTPALPSITTTVDNGTLVGMLYAWTANGITFNANFGNDWREEALSNSSGGQQVISVDQYLTTHGTLTGRTFTRSSADTNTACAFALKPA